jgi:SAM-dependent methyltransferase
MNEPSDHPNLRLISASESPLQTEPQPCPLCGDHAEEDPDLSISEPLFRLEDGFHQLESLAYKVCSHDGLIYMSARLSEESLDYYYRHSPQNLKPTPDHRLDQQISFIRDTVELSTGTILDVGCNTGDFLARWRDDGYETIGVEPSQPSHEYLRREHPELDVIKTSLEEAVYSLSDCNINLASLIHVLEHLVDPRAILQKLSSLDPDYLYLEVPDGSAPLYPRILKEHGHLAFYRPHHLIQLLSETGFEVLRQESRSSSIQLLAKKDDNATRPGNQRKDDIPQESQRQLDTVKSQRKNQEKTLNQQVDRWIQTIREEDLEVALFGAGTETVNLLNQMNSLHDQIIGIIDNHPFFQGRTLFGQFPISPPDHGRFTNVDVVIVSIKGQTKSIANQLEPVIPADPQIWGVPS